MTRVLHVSGYIAIAFLACASVVVGVLVSRGDFSLFLFLPVWFIVSVIVVSLTVRCCLFFCLFIFPRVRMRGRSYVACPSLTAHLWGRKLSHSAFAIDLRGWARALLCSRCIMKQ